MPRTHYRLLPPIREAPSMHVKMSQTITTKCKCGYNGFVMVVTGRSPGPIWKCPECNTICQSVETKGK